MASTARGTDDCWALTSAVQFCAYLGACGLTHTALTLNMLRTVSGATEWPDAVSRGWEACLQHPCSLRDEPEPTGLSTVTQFLVGNGPAGRESWPVVIPFQMGDAPTGLLAGSALDWYLGEPDPEGLLSSTLPFYEEWVTAGLWHCSVVALPSERNENELEFSQCGLR